MPCYEPLRAFKIPNEKTKNGKDKLKICPCGTDHIYLDKKGDWRVAPEAGKSSYESDVVYEYQEVPCGHCVGCRLDYSKQWADRCLLELQDHKESYFITLTYDDKYLPMTEYVDEDGVYHDVATLQKEDFQTFIRHLRQQTGQEIRYFACGEYGSHTCRPHYHAIIFGLHLGDLTPYKQSELGDWLYNSDTVSKAWDNKGHCVVGSVSYESCAYTARYVVKKAFTDDLSDVLGIEPEFLLMSRRPAIGKTYYEKHPECMNYAHIWVSTDKGAHQISIPRYFEKLYEKDYGADALIEWKLKRNNELFDGRNMFTQSAVYDKIRLDRTDLSYRDFLSAQEAVKISQIKSLKRKEL